MVVEIPPEVVDGLGGPAGVEIEVDQRVAGDPVVRLLLQVSRKLGDRGVHTRLVFGRLVVGNVQPDLGVADHPVEISEAAVDLARLHVVRQRRRVVFLLICIVRRPDLHPSLDLSAPERGNGKTECREKAQQLFHRLFNSQSSGAPRSAEAGCQAVDRPS